MEQSRGGGFFWVKVSRGVDSQQADAQWEPAYREGAMHSFVVLGESRDWAIWEYGPRLEPPDDLPKGAFHETR